MRSSRPKIYFKKTFLTIIIHISKIRKAHPPGVTVLENINNNGSLSQNGRPIRGLPN